MDKARLFSGHGGPLPFRQECLRWKGKGLPARKGRSPTVWVSCFGLANGDEFAVGTVGEQVTGSQVQGDLVRRDLDFAQAARERRGLVELEQLDVAARRELFADATESFNFDFIARLEVRSSAGRYQHVGKW
jgi:hypothetical protein